MSVDQTSEKKWINDMTKVEELEKAVDALSDKEYSIFRQRFLERDWEKWDRQIETDSKSGKLDFLIKEASEAKKSGNLENL